MKKQMHTPGVIILIFSAIVLSQSCAALNQMASVLANLKRLQFKISDVSDFRLAGIDIGAKSALTQFSALDGLTLVRAFASKNLPAAFVLNLQVVNPNTGTGGSTQTTSTLSGLECRLLIDGKQTVAGNIDHPFEIPGTGQATLVPVRLSLNLFEFFADKRYEDLINLALAIGGASRNPSRLALDAQPSVVTPLGAITYPGRITIVDKEFR
jgi:hypothetical protein